MDFVALLQAAQDRDRIFDRRLADEDRLEASRQGRVTFHVLAVFVEGRRADAAQLPPCERGLQHVRRIRGAFGIASPHDRVELVDEEDHLAGGLFHFTQHRLQSVLELAAVLGTRDQGADVEGDDPPTLESLRHVAVDDAKCEALGDRRLADAGLTYQDRVVLAAPRQDLNDATDLFVAPDHGVELARSRGVGQVRAELLEGLVLRLRIGVGDFGAAADRLEGLADPIVGDARPAQDPPDRIGFFLRHCEEQVLGRDVLVLHRGCFVERRLKHARGRLPHLGLRAAAHLRLLRDHPLHFYRERIEGNPELLEHGHGTAVGLREKCHQQMRGLEGLVPSRTALPLRFLQRFLALDRQLVEAHRAHLLKDRLERHRRATTEEMSAKANVSSAEAGLQGGMAPEGALSGVTARTEATLAPSGPASDAPG